MNRRSFLTGFAGLLAAPAIVRAGSLMPVKVIPPPRKVLSLDHLLFTVETRQEIITMPDGTRAVLMLDRWSSQHPWRELAVIPLESNCAWAA